MKKYLIMITFCMMISVLVYGSPLGKKERQLLNKCINELEIDRRIGNYKINTMIIFRGSTHTGTIDKDGNLIGCWYRNGNIEYFTDNNIKMFIRGEETIFRSNDLSFTCYGWDNKTKKFISLVTSDPDIYFVYNKKGEIESGSAFGMLVQSKDYMTIENIIDFIKSEKGGTKALKDKSVIIYDTCSPDEVVVLPKRKQQPNE